MLVLLTLQTIDWYRFIKWYLSEKKWHWNVINISLSNDFSTGFKFLFTLKLTVPESTSAFCLYFSVKKQHIGLIWSSKQLEPFGVQLIIFIQRARIHSHICYIYICIINVNTPSYQYRDSNYNDHHNWSYVCNDCLYIETWPRGVSSLLRSKYQINWKYFDIHHHISHRTKLITMNNKQHGGIVLPSWRYVKYLIHFCLTEITICIL